jgi:hypothetical protein
MVRLYQMNKEGSEPRENEKGIGYEHGPGKRRMPDMGCPGRKFQVRGDLLVCEEEPQNRKPQQHHGEQGRYDDGSSHGPDEWKYILMNLS